MEFDAFSYFQQNAQKLKIRESTSYGIHIDEDTNVIVSCTDFGHIHVYYHDMNVIVEDYNAYDANVVDNSNSDSSSSDSKIQKKTLHTETPPIYASQLATMSKSKILFCGGRNNNLRGYQWDTVLHASHNTVLSPTMEFSSGYASDENERGGNIVSIACVPLVSDIQCIYSLV